MQLSQTHVNVRPPTTADGAKIHTFVQQCPPLEVNTGYAYLLFTTHFRTTCAVAEDPEGIAGFVMGYRLPDDPETLFVWQIGVHERTRGTGLDTQLLNDLLQRPADPPVRYVAATVAPSNTASQRLFRRFAQRASVDCEERPCFEPKHFGGGAHEAETLFRLGPFPTRTPQNGE